MRHAHRAALSSLAVAGLVVATAPLTAAHAATVTSRSDASAVTAAVAGQGSDSGSVQATFDGRSETVTGNTAPSLPIPGGGFVNLGVLTQQATAGNGFSRACAGAAGNGGGIVQIGDGSCLTTGETVNGSLGDLGVGDITGGIEQLPQPVREVLAQVTSPVDAAIQSVVAPIQAEAGDLGLALRLNAVEGRCAVDAGTPSGSASIANASVVATGAGRTFTLANLPANPPPNTRVVTNLSTVVDVLLDGVSTNLNTSLDEALSPVDAALIAPLREQLVNGIRANLEQQLAPLEQNLVSIVLNEQTRPTPDSIRVTALRAEVLPVAREQLGAAAVDLRIGSVGCGPADRVGQAAAQQPEPEAAAAPPRAERIPTAVSAGMAGEPTDGPGALSYAALALGLAAAGTAGVAAARRRGLPG